MKDANKIKENTETLYIQTLTEIFFNMKRMNVCEQIRRMAPCDSFE